MKTYNRLFQQICSFENLLNAARKAQRSKRFQHSFKAIEAFFQSIKFIETLLFGGPVLAVKWWVAFSVKQLLIQSKPLKHR